MAGSRKKTSYPRSTALSHRALAGFLFVLPFLSYLEMELRPPGIGLFHDLLIPWILVFFVLAFNTVIVNLSMALAALALFLFLRALAGIVLRRTQKGGLLQQAGQAVVSPSVGEGAVISVFLLMALKNSNIPDTCRVPLLLLMVICSGLYLKAGERKNTKGLLARVGLTLLDFLFMLFAVVLIAMRPGWAAICWLFLLAVRILFSIRSQKPWFGTVLLFAMGACGIAGFVAANVVSYFNADPISGELISPGPTYDAAVNLKGELMALKRKPGAMLFSEGTWKPIPTNHPQRLVMDPLTNGFYISNYGARKVNVYTEVKDGAVLQHGIRKCERTIDIDLDPALRKLLVLCEGTNRLVIRDLDADTEGSGIDVRYCPYALSVSESLSRAYVSTLLGGITHAVNLKGGRSFYRYTGQGAGIQVDQKSGEVYLARHITGDLLVMDPDLRVRARIETGVMPRDISIDPVNRILLVGNYLSGTVEVVDLDLKKVTRVLRVEQSKGYRRILRGVEAAVDGFWYFSDWNGVWRVSGKDKG